MAVNAANSEILNGWKEIAHYMQRGVRTVQRWERELGLPVRRPHNGSRGAVIAIKADLDRWISNLPLSARAARPTVPRMRRSIRVAPARW